MCTLAIFKVEATTLKREEPAVPPSGDARIMLNTLWKKFVRSWWGRMIIGALIGVFAVGMVNPEPAFLLGAMIVGAVGVYLLGRLK